MKKAEIEKQINEKHERMKDILKTCDDEGPRLKTEAEATEWDKLRDDIQELETEKKRLEEFEAREKTISSKEDEQKKIAQAVVGTGLSVSQSRSSSSSTPSLIRPLPAA